MNGLRSLPVAFGICLLVISLSGVRAASASPDPSVDTVAVLSPHEGNLAEVGRAHDESVMEAFGLQEERLTSHLSEYDRTIHFLFRGTGTGTDSTTCATKAQNVVNEGAIAILGPVTSNCTRWVLTQNLEVPVLSSLATATDLGNRSEWFFRTIPNDRKRLDTFIDVADDHGINVNSSIAIYTSSDYGQGLHTDLTSLVSAVDSAHSFRWSDVVDPRPHGEVALTQDFRQTMNTHHAIETVFVLGEREGQEALLQELNALLGNGHGRLNFVVVGSADTEKVPSDTWLIGEPTVGTSATLVTDLADRNLSEDLYISTLDASIVLKSALENVLDQSDADPLYAAGMRRLLRDELNANHFASSERRRTVRFREGDVDGGPTTPIRRVSVKQQVDLVNREQGDSWVEVTVIDEPSAHLEGPVVVELTPRGDDLLQERVIPEVEGIKQRPIQLQPVELTRNGTRVSFAPSFFATSWFPSTFSVSTNRTPAAESKSVGPFGWPLAYPLAGILAILSALLYARHQQRQRDKTNDETETTTTPIHEWTLWTFAERCLAGIGIAFLVLHVAPLLETGPLSQIPIPQFGSSWWANTVASGILGGWLGLNPIVGLVASVVGALTPLFQS